VSTNAYDVGQHSSRYDIVKKAVEKKVIAAPIYSPTQVLCLKQRRTGSRVIENKCQTLAQWKQQANERAMRQYMIKPRGKSAAWDPSP